MGRGSSKISGSGGGRSVLSAVDAAIKQAETSPTNVTYADVRDIENSSYGLDTSRLSDTDRSELADIIYGSVMASGPTARNSMQTIKDINNKKVAQINISQLTTDELKFVARISAKISSTASSICLNDALKLINYYNS